MTFALQQLNKNKNKFFKHLSQDMAIDIDLFVLIVKRFFFIFFFYFFKQAEQIDAGSQVRSGNQKTTTKKHHGAS